MTKWLNAFLEFKNEASGTRKFALGAVVIITIGLASLSVTGIVATAEWTLLSWMPTFGLILAVLGAEALATVAFIRTLTASTKLRKVAGFLIFLGLAAVGVHNAENGAHVVWPARFEESAGSLSAKAELAGDEAVKLGETAQKVVDETPKELERVRTEIAELTVFQTKMSAMTIEGVKAAQSEMIPRCGYEGRVDGIRSVLTESAMRLCGEKIRGQLEVLRARELSLASAAPLSIQTATTDKSLLKIENEDKASAAFWAWFWLIFMLCVLESARSLSLWALITDLTGHGTDRDREREEELRELEHQNRMAELRAKQAKEVPAPEPEPVQAATEPPPETPPGPVEEVSPPEPPPPPPEPELTDAQRWGREGAKQAQLNRKAEEARQSRILIIGPVSTLDALKVAAE